MNKQDIINKIDLNGGEVIDGILKFTKDDTAITIESNLNGKRFVAFLLLKSYSGKNNLTDAHLSQCHDISDFDDLTIFVNAIKDLEKSGEPKEEESETIDCPPTERPMSENEARLSGKVEAYENLLIGRDINISK